jgi:lysophospholipase L1-like esterase
MRKFDRAWLTGCLLLVIAQAALSHPPSPQSWQHDIDRLVADDSAHPPPQHAVLFVGSSSIRMWTTLAADFPGVPVIDRGFGGSTIADSTYFADRIVIPYHPRLIVMYAGDNDIAEGDTPRQVLDAFETFVARVRRDLPNVAIAYISIKPSLARWSMWPRMREANRLIAAWSKMQSRVTFVDVATAMLDPNGKPRAALFRDDGLHMTPAGYAVPVGAATISAISAMLPIVSSAAVHLLIAGTGRHAKRHSN